MPVHYPRAWVRVHVRLEAHTKKPVTTADAFPFMRGRDWEKLRAERWLGELPGQLWG